MIAQPLVLDVPARTTHSDPGGVPPAWPARLVGVVAIMLAVVSCDRQGAPVPSPAAAGTVAPSAAGGPPSDSPSVGLVDALLPWQLVGRVPYGASYLTSSGGGHRIVPLRNGSEHKSVVVQEVTSNRTVARIEPGKGWEIDDIYFALPYAMVVQNQSWDPRVLKGEPAVRLFRLDLRSGALLRLDNRAGVAVPTQAQPWSLVGDGFFYGSRGRAGAACVTRLSMTSLVTTVLYCPEPSMYPGWIEASDAGIGLFENDAKADCQTNVIIGLDGRGRTALSAQAHRCSAYGAVALTQAAVWVEMPSLQTAHDGQVWARQGGVITRLGPGTPGSLGYCDGYAYWEVSVLKAGDSWDEVRRWQPGRPVEVIRRTHVEHGLGAAACRGTVMSITEATQTGENDHESVFEATL